MRGHSLVNKDETYISTLTATDIARYIRVGNYIHTYIHLTDLVELIEPPTPPSAPPTPPTPPAPAPAPLITHHSPLTTIVTTTYSRLNASVWKPHLRRDPFYSRLLGTVAVVIFSPPTPPPSFSFTNLRLILP